MKKLSTKYRNKLSKNKGKDRCRTYFYIQPQKSEKLKFHKSVTKLKPLVVWAFFDASNCYQRIITSFKIEIAGKRWTKGDRFYG